MLGKMITYPRPFGCSWGCTWAFQLDENTWDIAYDPSSCRSYLICYWYHVTKDKEYAIPYTKNRNIQPLNPDRTQIFWCNGNSVVSKATVEKNLPKLHEIEKSIGIELTKPVWLEDPSGDIGVVFIGDKCWQSTAWKISIYSYYLKCLFRDTWLSGGEYSMYLKPYFLEKVKDFNEEIYCPPTQYEGRYHSIHRQTGFVSIASGDNLVMKKLLQGEKDGTSKA